MKHSIIIEEIVNKDSEKTSNSIKTRWSSRCRKNIWKKYEKNVEKIIRSKKSNILQFVYKKDQVFEKCKANENFIDMIKNLILVNLQFCLKCPL